MSATTGWPTAEVVEKYRTTDAWGCVYIVEGVEIISQIVAPSKSGVVRIWNKHMQPFSKQSWEQARRSGDVKMVRVVISRKE